MKTLKPLLKAAVISVDILYVVSPIDTLSFAEVNHFMTEIFAMAKRLVSRVGITD